MIKRIAAFALIALLTACTSVPITGRKQLSIIPAAQMMALAAEQYQTTLNESKLSGNNAQVQQLRRVGDNIIKAVEKYLAANGQSDLIAGYQWEINLIESDQVNAWAMPGGKIAFYTGIMQYCNTDDYIAVVMGHEISHALANHGGERMSQMVMAQLGGVALEVALQNKPQQTRDIAGAAFGVGAQLGVLLPFSRLHESEADELGLYFMTMAGYNPYAAAEFWEKMAAGSNGQPPEFLSTHPSHETRIQKLRELAPQAAAKYGRG